MHSWAKVIAAVSVTSVVAQRAWAAAPVYFNLEGLIFGALIYVVALVVSLGAASASKSKTAVGVFLAVLVSPGVIFLADFIASEWELASWKKAHAQQVEAYRQFCSQPTFKGNTMPPSHGAALLFSSKSTSSSPDAAIGWAAAVARNLVERNQCAATGIRYIEAAWTAEGKNRFNRYELACPNVKRSEIDAPTATFELVFAEDSKSVVAPGNLPWGQTRLVKNSVRIEDLRTGATLASDWVYGTSAPSQAINAACPDRAEAMADLIIKVFPGSR